MALNQETDDWIMRKAVELLENVRARDAAFSTLTTGEEVTLNRLLHVLKFWEASGHIRETRLRNALVGDMRSVDDYAALSEVEV